ncbi:hypothetical protein NQZ68_031003 [Dissostichus eleginoides]|nr:hypothetical protein NQZ68_031003 [Dissostichus eleginoides]
MEPVSAAFRRAASTPSLPYHFRRKKERCLSWTHIKEIGKEKRKSFDGSQPTHKLKRETADGEGEIDPVLTRALATEQCVTQEVSVQTCRACGNWPDVIDEGLNVLGPPSIGKPGQATTSKAPSHFSLLFRLEKAVFPGLMGSLADRTETLTEHLCSKLLMVRQGLTATTRFTRLNKEALSVGQKVLKGRLRQSVSERQSNGWPYSMARGCDQGGPKRANQRKASGPRDRTRGATPVIP